LKNALNTSKLHNFPQKNLPNTNTKLWVFFATFNFKKEIMTSINIKTKCPVQAKELTPKSSAIEFENLKNQKIETIKK
jgi:hypothetical protein